MFDLLVARRNRGLSYGNHRRARRPSGAAGCLLSAVKRRQRAQIQCGTDTLVCALRRSRANPPTRRSAINRQRGEAAVTIAPE